MKETLVVFVPGRLVNPLNARRHWKAVWARNREMRMRTVEHVMTARIPLGLINGADPKRVIFTANVGAEWDDDNLPAAIKPHRDALKDAGVIDDDRPSAGHVFEYRQRIDRKNLGVEIVITRLAPDGG